MEAINPKLVSFEAKFFERRTKGSKPRKLRDATGLNYADHEVYFPLNDAYDGKDWVEYYMGKPYKWDNAMVNSNMFNQYYNSPEAPEKPKENDYRAFEIFTMGMEQLVH
ncbi:hypothetical protein SB749_18875, partial [Brevibacterium sp. SIMBA_078]|uniref:hypothetical protein n=1 Tax=Brevibacterium sp. SIMBA_078 TaxID=3085816 RepID=UPI00397C1207